MATNPLAPDPETDMEGPDRNPPLEPYNGIRERAWRDRPVPEGEQEDTGAGVPLEEEDDSFEPYLEPNPALHASE